MNDPITLPVAYKRPTKELHDSVQFVLTIDRAYLPEIIRWSAIDLKTPLKVIIEEIEDTADMPNHFKSDKPYDFTKLDEETKKRRRSLYGHILSLAGDLGYTEQARKNLQKEVVGKDSMADMSEDELDQVGKFLLSELDEAKEAQ